jgi:hypothetical protein
MAGFGSDGLAMLECVADELQSLRLLPQGHGGFAGSPGQIQGVEEDGGGLEVFRHQFVDPENPVGGGSARMHDALGNSLMIEVGDPFPQEEILEQGGAAFPGFERVLGTPIFTKNG